MSTVTVLAAQVTSDSDRNPCARIELRGDMYVTTLITGTDTQDEEPTSDYDAAVKLGTDHADEIDATPVDVKTTALSYAKQIADLRSQLADARATITELQAQAVVPAEGARVEL